jgi:hypothetical protein
MLTKQEQEKIMMQVEGEDSCCYDAKVHYDRDLGIMDNTDKLVSQKIVKELEKIAKYIEDDKRTNSQGFRITEYDKLCFVLQDIDKLIKEYNEEKTICKKCKEIIPFNKVHICNPNNVTFGVLEDVGK